MMTTKNENSSFLRANGLSLTLLALLLVSLAGQVFTGHATYNQERIEKGDAPVALAVYLRSGHLISATFENWESEFLQMTMYVLLTVVLRQRGSAESRPMDPSEEDPRIEPGSTPWPVRAGGWWRKLYEHSLAIVFGVLFAASFALHAFGSWRDAVTEQVSMGQPPPRLWTYLAEPRFWFESFQNWQSEFMAVLMLVVLTIWLRQKDSPQSKPVEAPNTQTGT
jgi:hypothetical protein